MKIQTYASAMESSACDMERYTFHRNGIQGIAVDTDLYALLWQKRSRQYNKFYNKVHSSDFIRMKMEKKYVIIVTNKKYDFLINCVLCNRFYSSKELADEQVKKAFQEDKEDNMELYDYRIAVLI